MAHIAQVFSLRLCALIMLRNIDCVLQTEGVPFLILNGSLTSTSIFFFF